MSSATESTPLVSTGKPHRSIWRAYFELTRLHKFPAGTLLVFWPCAWGLSLAAYSTGVPPRQLAVETAVFFLGSTLLHSAACVINDICDRDFDRQVERCKNRPIASGDVSIPGATIFLIVQVAAALALLAFTNRLALLVGLIGVFPLHAFYPLTKRWTHWPQAWLGLAMNWGLPVSWIALTGCINWPLLSVAYFGTFCWTIVYDTIYACQDKKDDVKAGVKSTALLFGDQVRPILAGFATVFVATLGATGFLNQQGIAYYAITVIGSALHFTWQLTTLNVDEGADCWSKFTSNGDIGYIIWVGILVDYYLKWFAA